MKTVTHIIKSPSFESDGRLQKWIKSLRTNGIKSDVYFVDDDNKKGVRFVEDIKIESNSLFFRKYFKKRSGYIFKIPEYSFKTPTTPRFRTACPVSIAGRGSWFSVSNA